jgi:hypothetical protein
MAPLIGEKRPVFGREYEAAACPLLGVKRTSLIRGPMSAFDPKRTLAAPRAGAGNPHSCQGTKADIPDARRIAFAMIWLGFRILNGSALDRLLLSLARRPACATRIIGGRLTLAAWAASL